MSFSGCLFGEEGRSYHKGSVWFKWFGVCLHGGLGVEISLGF